MTLYKTVTFNNIRVFYTDELDGGGKTFRQGYLYFLTNRINKVNYLFEWCCEPAFISFSLLSNGFYNSVCLADINPSVIDACNRTIEENNLEDKVFTYVSDSLENKPATKKWDWVVGNPPHLGVNELRPSWGPLINYIDQDWAIHRRFYLQVKKHLTNDGQVIIQENRE